MDGSAARYVGAWAGAAVVAVAGLVLASEPGRIDPVRLLAILAVITLAELIVVYIDIGRAGAAFTLSEAAITAGLFVVAPLYVVLGSAGGMLLAHLPRRLSADKVVFNVSQVTVATTVAGLIVLATPDLGPVIGERALATVVVAMVAYAAVNTLAFRGLVARIAGTEGVRDFTDQAPLTLASMLGTVAVGIVAAALWESWSFLIPLLLVPVLAIQVAARSSLAAARLVSSLRTERDRLDQVVRGASDGILLLDAEGTVQVWSPALEELTGVTADQAVGADIADLLAEVRRDPPVRGRWELTGATPDHPHRRAHARWRSAGGEVRDVQEDHALLFDERGHATGDVVLVRDVSREAELERLRADFVSRISHELRTPLTPIRGYVQLLLRRGDRMSLEQRNEALSGVLDGTDRLGEIVEDLLLVTQLERGQLAGIVTATALPVEEVLTRVVAEAGQREPDRRVDLTVSPGTPPAWADPRRLRQALAALLDNALRYSAPDTPVIVTAGRDGNGVRIRVLDQGPGIPAAQRLRIFERFQRLEDPMTMRTSGVGLGLFIARQLVEAMGGRLELEDPRPGHCVFAVHLRAIEGTVHVSPRRTGAIDDVEPVDRSPS